MKTKKLLYAFLKEVQREKCNFSNEDLGVVKEEFYDIIRLADREGYIINVLYADDIPYVYNLAQITMKGIDYLEQNSSLAKTYKGLKEVRDWVKALESPVSFF